MNQEENVLPQGPPRATPWRIVVFFVCALAGGMIVVCVGVYGYFVWRASAPAHVSAANSALFTVVRGESPHAIARNLEQKGFVDRAIFFSFAVWRDGLAPGMQAGIYAFPSHASPRDIAHAIASGAVYRTDISVTIPEGFTLAQTDKRFKQTGLFSGDTLARFTVADLQTAYPFLEDAPGGASLEGYLFPDTYFFDPAATASTSVGKMLDNFGEKFAREMREETRRQGKSIFEIVTMASLIQKEVITEEDMKLVSGILWKRLAIGMPLEVDATVAYAVGHTELSLADLQADSPYNTYRRRGLPPGPIANPGAQALAAALTPTDSDQLFYLSKPDGATVFSKTFQEHLVAKNTYLR